MTWADPLAFPDQKAAWISPIFPARFFRPDFWRAGLLLLALLLLLSNRDQFHLEHQGVTGSDVAALRSTIAVGQIGWNKQLPFRSHWHQLQRFSPSLDHSAHRKGDGTAMLGGGVEFLAIDQRPAIVAGDRIAGRRLGPVAFL